MSARKVTLGLGLALVLLLVGGRAAEWGRAGADWAGWLGAVEARADEQAGQQEQADIYYAVYGVGSWTCREWSKRRRGGGLKAAIGEEWVAGFVTSFSLWANNQKNVAEGIAAEALYKRIDRICRQSPYSQLDSVASAVVLGLLDG